MASRSHFTPAYKIVAITAGFALCGTDGWLSAEMVAQGGGDAGLVPWLPRLSWRPWGATVALPWQSTWPKLGVSRYR